MVLFAVFILLVLESTDASQMLQGCAGGKCTASCTTAVPSCHQQCLRSANCKMNCSLPKSCSQSCIESSCKEILCEAESCTQSCVNSTCEMTCSSPRSCTFTMESYGLSNNSLGARCLQATALCRLTCTGSRNCTLQSDSGTSWVQCSQNSTCYLQFTKNAILPFIECLDTSRCFIYLEKDMDVPLTCHNDSLCRKILPNVSRRNHLEEFSLLLFGTIFIILNLL